MGKALRWLVAGTMALTPISLAAQTDYQVSFDNARHHEAQIAATFTGLGRAPARIQMSRSSPGRYAIHEFAKNVYSVSATDGAGRPLRVLRTVPYGWIVPGHDGTVRFAYTLYADRADGTYSQVDTSHAHLNMPATFAWATGLEKKPFTVTFNGLDPDWRVATQLEPLAPTRYRAPHLQYFMDSPVEISALDMRQWAASEPGHNYTVRLALHHRGADAEAAKFAAMAERVYRQHVATWGDIPDYDFGTYTFLADYLPHVSGDGMEHRNSTYLTDERSLAEADYDQIQTLSHEIFHSWNVERLRPAELEPFDFTRANSTPSLWFAEGFTSYYGPLLVRRARISDIDAYLKDLAGTLNYVLLGPGRRYGSPQEMSIRAPFVDAATSIDPANPNIFTSYYPYGATIGLALDLTLRRDFPGVTLDHYMRDLWRTHGVPEKPFTPADLEAALARVSGNRAFARQFFARHIESPDLPDYTPLLAQAGLTLRPQSPQAPFVGQLSFKQTGDRLILAQSPAPDSPIYAAGLDRGDRILSLGGRDISSEEDWMQALGTLRPGQRATIGFDQRGTERSAAIVIAADPRLEIVRNEIAGRPLTAGQRQFRDAWLGAAGVD